MKIIREKYVNNPYFDPNLVKKVATACEGLCRWVRAIEVYDRVIKIVSPKKAKLADLKKAFFDERVSISRFLSRDVSAIFMDCNHPYMGSFLLHQEA